MSNFSGKALHLYLEKKILQRINAVKFVLATFSNNNFRELRAKCLTSKYKAVNCADRWDAYRKKYQLIDSQSIYLRLGFKKNQMSVVFSRGINWIRTHYITDVEKS